MNDKLELDIDSTALGNSHCMKKFILTTIGSIEDDKIVGGYKQPMGAAAMYGVAVHKFIDTMYKTNGHIKRATDDMLKVFNLPKKPAPDKQQYLADERHLHVTAMNLWNDYVAVDQRFDVLSIPAACYWCHGSGSVGDVQCKQCNGTGMKDGPASELTFRILIYEDNNVRIHLCGTIDNLGKFDKGCFAIRDFKTTSSYSQENYISNYELSRQLRVYTLALKYCSTLEPGSVLGKIGATRVGSFIDAVFLKPKANDNEYVRSPVYQYSDDDLEKFKQLLQNYCMRISDQVSFMRRGHNYLSKEGMLHGTCSIFSKCCYWACCKSNEVVEKVLLARDFQRKKYNPLDFNSTD